MLTTLVTIALMILSVATVGFAFWRLSRLSELARWQQRENMPRELRWATLFASEQAIRCDTPVALNGIPDQVYRSLSGRLLLVDTKTRSQPRVYDADIVQLSVYRVIILNTAEPPFAGRRVSGHGYIRLSTPDGVRYERVDLHKTGDVLIYHQRYQALVTQQVTPDLAGNRGLCRQCGHRNVCPALADVSSDTEPPG